jgi:hypothetical protein
MKVKHPPHCFAQTIPLSRIIIQRTSFIADAPYRKKHSARDSIELDSERRMLLTQPGYFPDYQIDPASPNPQWEVNLH